MIFDDRFHAGRLLAQELISYGGQNNVLVLGMPRGGLPVAFEVARVLQAPLDLFMVRKLGLPGREELAMGAVASGNVKVINESVVEELEISAAVIERVAFQEFQELNRREQLYRVDKAPEDIQGKIAILVDDGLATGSTMRAAVTAVRRRLPSRLVVAVPVGSQEACAMLQREADEVHCFLQPEVFLAVSSWYREFSQTSDGEVRELLQKSAYHKEYAPAF